MDSGTFSSAGVADVTNPQTASDRDKYVLLFPAVRDLRYLYSPCDARPVCCRWIVPALEFDLCVYNFTRGPNVLLHGKLFLKA